MYINRDLLRYTPSLIDKIIINYEHRYSTQVYWVFFSDNKIISIQWIYSSINIQR